MLRLLSDAHRGIANDDAFDSPKIIAPGMRERPTRIVHSFNPSSWKSENFPALNLVPDTHRPKLLLFFSWSLFSILTHTLPQMRMHRFSVTIR